MTPTIHKYIIAQGWHGPWVIVFDRLFQHSEMLPKNTKALSAGFVQVIGPGEIVVMPNIGSDTLGLNPRPEDAPLLQQFFSSPLTQPTA